MKNHRGALLATPPRMASLPNQIWPPPSIMNTIFYLGYYYFASVIRRAARRGQGSRLTTLNFRTGAVTTLNFFHVLIFFMK